MSWQRNIMGEMPGIVALVAVLSLLGGCKKDGTSETAGGETTAGGEVPPGVDLTPSGRGALAAEGVTDAESPWGKTRAEQCQQPARTALSGSAASSFEQGVRAAQGGDASGAKSSFESALSSDPKAYPALYNLGVLEDRAGNEAGALDAYQRALGIQPDYEEAARGIATIMLRRNNVSAALSAVEPLARQFSTNLELQALYAEVLVAASRYDSAWSAARAALKCDERHVPSLIALIKASYAQGRDELGDSILEQGLAVDARNAELHFIQGERYKDQPGRLRDALNEYEQAVRLRPDYAEARMALGIQQLAGGNYPSALSHFQAARALVPTLPAAHVNLGDAYRATKQWTESRNAYDRALQLQSKLPEAHYGLGLLYLTAAAEFPGLDELSSLQKAQEEFKLYRREMGPKLSRDDQSTEYLKDLDRLIQRVQRRKERERNAASSEGGEG